MLVLGILTLGLGAIAIIAKEMYEAPVGYEGVDGFRSVLNEQRKPGLPGSRTAKALASAGHAHPRSSLASSSL